MLYSWYNKTNGSAYFWEDKELLNWQRRNGMECINVESHIVTSKKQLRGKPPIALMKRVYKGIR